MKLDKTKKEIVKARTTSYTECLLISTDGAKKRLLLRKN
jgi:hypothetical protein